MTWVAGLYKAALIKNYDAILTKAETYITVKLVHNV